MPQDIYQADIYLHVSLSGWGWIGPIFHIVDTGHYGGSLNLNWHLVPQVAAQCTSSALYRLLVEDALLCRFENCTFKESSTKRTCMRALAHAGAHVGCMWQVPSHWKMCAVGGLQSWLPKVTMAASLGMHIFRTCTLTS